MPDSPRLSHRNNFDLIRLAAASQVAIDHGAEHLGLRLPFHETTMAVLECFPGVPIFFLISGFLIAASYERQPLGTYALNRALRIFPALWACLAVSAASVWASGYFSGNAPAPASFITWLISQATVVQFYNPDFLRGYGVGALNGSLWTIPIEIQFYVLAPFAVVLFRRWPVLFWAAIATLAAVNVGYFQLPETVARKLLGVTFLPWVYMFLLGAAVQFFWATTRAWFEGKFLIWIAAYCALIMLDITMGIGVRTNAILPPYVLILSGLVLSAAYSKPLLADRVLNRNDISYSLYLYHMPVYNFVLYKQLGWGWLAVAVAVMCAVLSWKLIEQPALALKGRILSPKVAQTVR